MILDCDITILLTVRNETFRKLAKKQYFMVRLTIGVDLPPPLMVSLTTKYVFYGFPYKYGGNLYFVLFYSKTISDNYSKFELPLPEDVNKIYISIDIDEVFFYITFLDHFFGLLPYYPLFHSHLKVLRINDKDYSITFATYFNVEWYEHRLKVAKELEVSVTASESHPHIFDIFLGWILVLLWGLQKYV